MKSILKKIFLPQATHDTSKTLAKAYEESTMTSLWEDTGEMYFLIETLKLCFESELGSVCYERIEICDALELLKQLQLGNTPAFRQKIIASQPTEIRLSVSGLSWQTLHGNIRTRAVSDAAILRATDPEFQNSQAVFKHADRIHDLDASILTLPNQLNIFTYEHITPLQFMEQLNRINKRFTPGKGSSVNVNRENYIAPFTEHENNAIHSLSEQLKLSDSKHDYGSSQSRIDKTQHSS